MDTSVVNRAKLVVSMAIWRSGVSTYKAAQDLEEDKHLHSGKAVFQKPGTRLCLRRFCFTETLMRFPFFPVSEMFCCCYSVVDV